MAENDSTRARLYGEELAQLVVRNRAKQVTDVLAAATGKVPAPELHQWRQRSEAILEMRQTRQSRDDTKAREDYVQIINERRNQAAQQNDGAEVSRYDQILKSVESDAQQ